MNNVQTTDYILPAHWASVLINLDYTGFSDEDEAELDSFIDGEFDGLFDTVCVADDSEPEFVKYHDAHNYGVPACDCLRYTFTH